jgi:hypothetical protein
VGDVKYWDRPLDQALKGHSAAKDAEVLGTYFHNLMDAPILDKSCSRASTVTGHAF